MGFFFAGYTLTTILTFIALVSIVALGNEITRRSKALHQGGWDEICLLLPCAILTINIAEAIYRDIKV